MTTTNNEPESNNPAPDTIAGQGQPAVQTGDAAGAETPGSDYDVNMHYPFGAQVAEQPIELVAEAKKADKEKLVLYAASAVVVVVVIAAVLATGVMGHFGGGDLFKPKPAINDLGAAPFAASGLIGHLITRSSDGKLQYKLRMEPDSVQQIAWFSTTIDKLQQPISFDFVLKDSSGFTLCGKKVWLTGVDQPPADSGPSPAAPAANSQGQAAPATSPAAAPAPAGAAQPGDTFQSELNSEGQVTALNAQGDLPCTMDAYKKIDYWDFSTDFPAVGTQMPLREQTSHVMAAAPVPGRMPRTANGFYVEGDDIIRSFDSGRAVIETIMNKHFFVDARKAKPAELAAWAVSGAQIRYRCDQNGSCTITRDGFGKVVHARLFR